MPVLTFLSNSAPNSIGAVLILQNQRWHMSNCNSKIQIDDNIRSYLDIIAKRLWSTPSHAAIMVGAGFSKNANKGFPDWPALGNLFFEKIHGRKPDKDKEEDRYLNVLKLADEVQANTDHQELDQLLRSNIPDNDSEPSALHIKLLELPWSDVFTTNYDTLLERAKESVSSQKFDTIVNKEDLVYSEKPRIIKLHGCISSKKRPLIITEEDYRTYPKEFAPFVNTVQQSLLENTLCLIGFSGNDPNFLQWVGWIRDNLGEESSPEIYLIGIFNLSEAQKKLLKQRNIVLVDLDKCPGVNKDPYKALELFFTYLESCQEEYNRLNCFGHLKKVFPDIKADKETNLKEVVEEWRQTRLGYPGWVIVPEDQREKLWSATINWADYISLKDKLTDQLDLRFSFELNWRLERCLWPLSSDVIELFEAVISKYWPFKETFDEQSEVSFTDKSYKNLDWEEIRKMWLHLFLAMLRVYREEGFFEKWDKTNKKLNDLIKYLSKAEKAFLHYERVLYALFKPDIHKVKAELSSWPTDFSIPFWEAKRAGLLAEIGQTGKAEQILERSLQEIRSKLNLNPVTTDYTLVSEEAIVMVLLKYIKNSKGFFGNFTEATEEEINKIRNGFLEDRGQRDSDREKDRKDTVITEMSEDDLEMEWNRFFEKRNNEEKPGWNKRLIDIRSSEIEVLSKTLQKRWDDLKQYKCDPRNEIKLFENQLQIQPIEQIPVTEKYEFDIGRITEIRKTGNYNKEVISAYKFLRYFEESGFPFKIPGTNLDKKSAEGALTSLSKYSPYWAMATLIRIGDAKITNLIFNRQALLKYSADELDTLIDKYLEVLYRFEQDMNDRTGLNVDNFGILSVQIVPEILSRLCCKCSKDKKLLLLGFLRKVYASEYKNNYRGIYNLLKRLLETFSVYEQYQLLPKLVEIPYPKNTSVGTEREYVNPFHLINIRKADLNAATKVDLKPEIIELLFNLASSENESERKWGTFSLVQLYNLKLLTHDQSKKLGVILWSNIDCSGFPTNTDYCKFAFLNFPHPVNINPTELIKNYIKNTDFPIHDIQKQKSFSVTPDYIPLCNEIIGANQFVDWSTDEINNLLERLVQWWNADRKYLKQDKVNILFGSIAENVEKSFARLIDVLVEVVLPVLNDDLTSKSQRNAINQLVREFSEYGFYTVRVKSASLPLLQLEEDVLLTEIENALSSEDEKEVIDGLKALLILLKTNFPIKNNIIKKTLVLLGQKIRWQHQAGLVSALNTVTLILREYQKYFNGELETLCLHGVKTLATETSFSLNKNLAKADFFRRLGLRQAAAYLAFTLYKFYDNKETDIPEEVLLWRTICSSQDEFAEIRVQWQDGN